MDAHSCFEHNVANMGKTTKALAVTLLWIPFAWSKPCQVSRSELKVYEALPIASGTERSIVESLPQWVAISVFDLGPYQLRDAASGLTERLRSVPVGSTLILPSPPADFVTISPAVQKEITQNYAAKLRERCTIPFIKTACMIVIKDTQISAFERQREKHGVSGFWSRFHQQFGADASLCNFSRVAFDNKQTFAVVHVSCGVSPMGGGGMLYLLRNTSAGWSVIRSYPTWAT